MDLLEVEYQEVLDQFAGNTNLFNNEDNHGYIDNNTPSFDPIFDTLSESKNTDADSSSEPSNANIDLLSEPSNVDVDSHSELSNTDVDPLYEQSNADADVLSESSNADEVVPDVVRSDTVRNYLTNDKVPVNNSNNEKNDADADRIERLYGDLAKPCCSLSCNKNIPKDIALRNRRQFLDLNKSEQDLVLLGHIQAARQIPGIDHVYTTNTSRSRFRMERESQLKKFNMMYQFASLIVCRTMFFFLHEVGLDRFKNLLKHFVSHGLSPRTHKSALKSSTRDNVINAHDVELVVTFIQNYAETFALPLRGCFPSFRNFAVMKLPSTDSKMSVYREYCFALQTTRNPRILSHTSFHQLWNKHVPYIIVQKPTFDLCDICRSNVTKIQLSSNLVESAKKEAVVAAMEHLEQTRIQREYYSDWKKKAEDQNETTVFGVTGKFAVFSFDFTERVHYPSHPTQVGPAYFRNSRRCDIFGIHDERTHKQMNYLIDEAENVAKSASCVVSLLHDYFSSVDANIVILFADNCREQTKNEIILQYLLWRVLTFKNEVIEYNFVSSGHVKFSPDQNFGLLKFKYSRTVVDCQADLVKCVYESSANGYNLAKATLNLETGEREVIWSKWREFLNTYFQTFPPLGSRNHFLFKNSQLMVKSCANSEFVDANFETSSLNTIETAMIEDYVPEGLSLERQWYLYEIVRNLCTEESKKDFVAPMPSMPKPKKVKKRKKEDGPVAEPKKPGRPPKMRIEGPRKAGRPKGAKSKKIQY